ncbi:peptidase domain-containing ABC transporter [Anaerocolumna sp. AGMB13020]|uniref:peptidase domain-containing ABC transporter n=1 Tax=Anaerocolumna sp. AGMB13020 TaxID=3081750 RepID=UPI002953C2F0|nr:peptidase domain-containing ABC transporter [Anaerocolumna sp. AGMB13020]WOO34667.1 peptidase domain-containing ABC transporter [Anaerocolumna sp. AGMB13020]
MVDKYYCVKQHDITDCGAACLATISRQYGFKTSISKIREVAGTDRHGTNAYGMIKAAEQLGFTAKGVKGDRKSFFSEYPLPCIAHVVVDGALLHYVVIHKITAKQIIIADPGKGIIKLSPDEFLGEIPLEGNGTGSSSACRWTGILILLVPGAAFEKGDETKGLSERFFSLLLPQKQLLLQVFTASLFITAIGILVSFYFKLLIDEVLPLGLLKTLHRLSLGVILLNFFKVILSALRSHMMMYLSQKLDIALLLGYYRHVLKLPMNFFDNRKVGEIISRFNDASKVREAISGAALTIMIDTLMAITGGIILFLQNAQMFGVTAVVVVLYFFIVWSFNKWYKKLNQTQMEDSAQLTSYMVESLNGIQTVKAYNAESKLDLETERRFTKLLKSVFKLSWVSNLQGSLVSFTELTGGIVILWVGAYNVIKGNISPGQLITYNFLLAYFLEPVKNLINLQPQMQMAVVAAQRLGEVLDLEFEKGDMENNKRNLRDLKGDIQFKDITFRYGTRKPVLEGVNIHIKQGEKIALVGGSGSGKTTLSKLLLNLYSPESGEILINGNNIKDIQLEALRNRIAYIPQETFLFSGSIMDNLMLGLGGITPEEVMEAAKKAQAHDFISELPFQYNTRLEENGSNLSGGQRQRLAIARAILRKPDILILDEATSNLDSITEWAIENTIEEYSKGMTTIIIAHRLSTIRRCDRIYVMEKGKIIEYGNHQTLIDREGQYAVLWRQQAG